MQYIKSKIEDVFIIEPEIFGDDRGFFMETWRHKSFIENISNVSFLQDNHSKSTKNTLRGLHYQTKKPQGKLVRVIQGSVFDVAVDLRKDSPSFGQWVGYELSESNKKMLWVPPGFAHGFLVISETAEFVYKCTDYYHPEYERSLIWNDPSVAIDWPLGKDTQPLLSTKDQEGDLLENTEPF